MELHRLVLANYRGIAHREIVFPDSGVVIVGGANEIGKSSMIEALDLQVFVTSVMETVTSLVRPTTTTRLFHVKQGEFCRER